MAKYQHIVAAVELDGADIPVVAAAQRIADQQSAKLSILTVVRPVTHLYAGLDTVLGPEFEAQLRQAAQSEVKNLCRTRHVPERCARVDVGEPGATIAEFAERHAADLIVVGAHDRHGLEYFVGTNATAVLHRAHCDVLGVRVPSSEGNYRLIVVGIDGEPGSREVLDRARDIARGGNVHVVLVVKPPLSGYAVSSDEFADNPLLDDLAAMEQHVIEVVQGLVDSAGFANVEVEVLHGKPSQQIKRYLQRIGADLVVMGSGDHVGVGWMIGSTTNNVLHGGSCDALVVRKRLET